MNILHIALLGIQGLKRGITQNISDVGDGDSGAYRNIQLTRISLGDDQTQKASKEIGNVKGLSKQFSAITKCKICQKFVDLMVLLLMQYFNWYKMDIAQNENGTWMESELFCEIQNFPISEF